MIPLHLASTTVHVDAGQAEALIAAKVAEWLPLAIPALRGTARSDHDVLALLG